MESLQGEWTIEKAEMNGKADDNAPGVKVTIEKTTMTVELKLKKVSHFKINVTKTPLAMDLVEDDIVVGLSIFEIDGDTLRICGGSAEARQSVGKDGKLTTEKLKVKDRPTKLDSMQGPLVVLKRTKK